MPKVFRPKILQSSTKNSSKEVPVSPPLLLDKERSSSPQNPVCEKSVSSPKFMENSTITVTTSHSVVPITSDSTVINVSSVDIDQSQFQASKVDYHPTLFVQRKVKHFRTKDCGDPLPDANKPLDRSAVSLRSLLRWVPVNKPPPLYRQERSQVSVGFAKDKPNETDIKKIDISEHPVSPVKPLQESSNLDMLAPQLRLDADGNIVLDEASLVVSLPTSNLDNMRHVTEESGILSVTYNSFRSPAGRRGGRWKPNETLRFYRALSTLGCDFYLMSKLFPNRSRTELKRKLKRESRDNPLLVNQALRNRRNYDLTALIPLSDEEEDNEDVKPEVKPKPYVRRERGVRKNPKRRIKCDPDEVDKTIDFVLAQLTEKSHASTNSNSSLVHCDSAGSHQDDITKPTTSVTSSAQDSALLERMISKKRAEINAYVDGTKTSISVCNATENNDTDDDGSSLSSSLSEVMQQTTATPRLSVSMAQFTGQSSDLLRLRDELLGE